MADAGTLSVNVTARIEDFRSKLNSAVSQANRFSGQLESIGKENYFTPMLDSIKGAQRDLKQIVQGIILAQTFYQGIQLFKNLTVAVYEYTDSLNYAKVTFSNLFRDASLGEEFVSVLQQYASRSPFDFSDVEQGARSLAAYGIEAKNLMFVMQGIGNLASVTGDPQTFETVSRAIGQINAKGKLSAEEMRQLAEAGLNVKAVYERLGVEAGNLGKANVDSATAINAIIDVLNTNYAGAMNAANMTMRGMIGNVKDVLLSTVSAVYQPAYEKMQKVLLGFQRGLNEFQDVFQAEGLAAAIEHTFGPEVLTRIQQLIATVQYLGNSIYQLLVPAFKILGTYGQAVVTVFGLMADVIVPILNVFAALLNDVLNTAAGMRILQVALLGLAAMKIVGGFATFLTNAISLLSIVLSKASGIAGAASTALGVLTTAELTSAGGARAAAAAWTAFSRALNVNPIVLAITVILALVAAIMGLRSVLGKVSDSTASLNNTKFNDYLKNIKQSTGDIGKFNNALEGTADTADDVADSVSKSAKKAQEGLLSFDEVFKLPEKADSGSSPSGSDDAGTDLGNFDMADFEMPELEPIDFRDLLPDLNSLWDIIQEWLNKQDWATLGGIITKGIASGIGKAGMYVNNAGKLIIDDLKKTLARRLDTFKIKARIRSLAKQVASGKGTWQTAGKELSEALTKEIEQSLGEDSTAALKVQERLDKIIVEAETASKKSWRKSGAKLVQELNEDLNKAMLNIHLSGKPLSEQFNILAKQLEEDGVKVTLAGRNIGKNLEKAFAESFDKSPFERMWKNIGDSFKDLKVTFDPKVSLKGISDAIKDFDPKVLFEGVVESIKNFDPVIAVKAFVDKIKGAFTPQRIATFLKTGLKDMGITIIGEILFDTLAEWLDNNGFTEASKFAGNFGPIVASALGTAIATKNPWGLVVGAIWGALFEALGTGLEEGDWSSFASTLMGALGTALSKIFGKGKGGGLLAVGSIISDLIFGSIADSMAENGDENGAALMRGIGDVLSGALGGASIGMLFGPIGALAGAIIGALVALLAGHWDEVVQWWENTAVPFFESLPSKIGEFFANADQWLSDPEKNPLAGLYNGIKYVWENIITPFFSGIYDLFMFFFTGDDAWLEDSGEQILTGLQNGILFIWARIVEWFTALPRMILAFFTGDDSWLNMSGEDILNGLFSGISTIAENIFKWFGSLPDNITQFFANAGTWLLSAGTNLLIGLKNGIITGFNNAIQFIFNIPSKIMGCFTNAGSWLKTAGQNILTGFYNGLVSGWNNVTGFIGRIGSWIQEHKGPEAYDKALLVPAGNWIMEGLDAGLQDRFKGVLEQVKSFGPQMEMAFTTPQLNVGANAIETITQAPATVVQPQQQVEEVPNPYINQQDDTSNNSQRPIMYVGTLIADKQGLRELKKKLDIVDSEQSRYR